MGVPIFEVQAKPVEDLAELGSITCAAGFKNHENEMRLVKDSNQLYHCHDPGTGFDWTAVSNRSSTSNTIGYVQSFQTGGKVAISLQVQDTDNNPEVGIRTFHITGGIDLNVQAESGGNFVDGIRGYFFGSSNANEGIVQPGGQRTIVKTPGTVSTMGAVQNELTINTESDGSCVFEIRGLANIPFEPSVASRCVVHIELLPLFGTSGVTIVRYDNVNLLVPAQGGPG